MTFLRKIHLLLYYEFLTEMKFKGKEVPVQIGGMILKGILRDHSSDSALNFHKIRDVCIFVMVLDVLT